MRDRNLVGGPVNATTKRKKKKRHLESGRYKRNQPGCWRWTRTGAQKRNGNRRLDVDKGEEDDEEEPEEGTGTPGEDRETNLEEEEDETTARRLPRVVGSTTGAGVGLPLLLLVVAVLGNQTCTTTAAPVVSDTYVSLDATPPRLLPRIPAGSTTELFSTHRRTTRRYSNPRPGNPSDDHPPINEELDYHGVSSIERDALDRGWLFTTRDPSKRIDNNVTKDSFSLVPGESTRRGGRGGGGLAHERTKSKRRQIAAASLLDDRGSTELDQVQPYRRLQATVPSRDRHTEPFSTLVRDGESERHATVRGGFVRSVTKDGYYSTRSYLEDTVGGRRFASNGDSSSTITTAPLIRTTVLPYRPVDRTVPRLLDDEGAGGSEGREEEAGGKDERNRKNKGRGVADKNGDRFAVAGDDSGEVIGGGGGGVVEWTTTTVAGPMSSWSYHPEDEEPGAGSVRTRPGPEEAVSEDEENDGEQVKVTVAQPGKGSSTSTPGTTSTTQLPPPSQDTSMGALSASSYIVSAVLVLVVGALVGVLATVSHHLHHRRLLLHEPASASILHHHRHDHHHHHHRHRHHHHHHHHHSEELPASHQRRLLLQDHHRHPGTPVSPFNSFSTRSSDIFINGIHIAVSSA
ncbi:hypothetical protein WN55_00192 [Dufourea novaeangliae]|uniref:Uncharacterized protein n=1 Tax=Dufourea novaeangliae TaxID=178035 RepID=A0A154PE85_DUFNO|nr:hypothetical protein WN55_00192 [Dufourea novaeangliae]